MPYPIIGMTTFRWTDDKNVQRVSLARAYVEALIHAGGVPVLIPSGLSNESLHSIYRSLDGILFSGGGDIAPDRSGGDPHPNITGVDPERDLTEFSLLDLMKNDLKPFLGICRGFQLVNAGMGGTLYAHIKDQMPGAQEHDFHSGQPRNYLAHGIRIDKDSKLSGILGEISLSVNSLHHQGAREIPATLKPVAWAPDGLVEGLELPDHPFGIAVQWHPEELTDHPPMRNLFRAFVQSADNFRNEK
jgi:putative glutamine amidotransferase